MSAPFHEIWASLRAELEAQNRRLKEESTEAWKDLESLFPVLTESFRAVDGGGWRRGTLLSLQGGFDSEARCLLLDPLESLRKTKPQQRVLKAIDDRRSRLEEILFRLPDTMEASPREVAEAAGPPQDWRRWTRRLRGRSAKSLPLRPLVARELREQERQRAELDGAFLLLLAQASLALALPWQITRREALRAFSGDGPLDAGHDWRPFEKQREQWIASSGALVRRAAHLQKLFRKWEVSSPHRLGAAVLRRRLPSEASASVRTDKAEQLFQFWSRQQRAVAGLLNLEERLADIAKKTVAESLAALETLCGEHQALLQELDGVIRWLENWQRDEERQVCLDAAESFPPPSARLVSAADHTAKWVRAVSSAARTKLPFSVETVEPKRALPGRRAPWRQVLPPKVFLDALEDVGRQIVSKGFQEAENEHRVIVQEIEHTREVVSFALETLREEGPGGLPLAREGLSNALSLVRHQRKTVRDPGQAVESNLTRATAAVFAQGHVALEEGRLGLLAFLARQSGTKAALRALELAPQTVRALSRHLQTALRKLYRWLLLEIGWEAPVVTQPQSVVRSGYFAQALNLGAPAGNLPLIYKRLFRLVPIEDTRFLVGRETEMAALAEARQLWESGRCVSVILVGARGSGKTSLLNCAVAEVFQGAEWVRGKFGTRLTEQQAVRDFLHGLLHVPAAESLAASLRSQRRIVIVEELERTFLRRIGGFEALRELLRLIAETSQSILWIFSINQAGFQFLDSTVGLRQYFTHRINAMSVGQADLEKAVLLRHNLSGLRLQFARPPELSQRTNSLRKLIGLEPEPREVFFDALYRQSEGIFRAAFELWQLDIQRAEGGVLYLCHPEEPDYDALLSSLTPEHRFLLQAILQHGLLTVEECSTIFGTNHEESRSQLDRLLALEILQPEPESAAFRIRPEAVRMVREALHRQNLL